MPRRRRAILDAAARAFVDVGYADSSIGDVAQAAGVAKATVIYHFGSKDALLRELVDPLVARISTISLSPPSTPAARASVLSELADAICAHVDAARVLTANPLLWRRPIFGGRMVPDNSRLVGLLTDGREDRESVIRAQTALATIFRGLTLGPGVDDAPVERHSAEAAIILAIAGEVLEGGVPPDS